MKKTASLMGVFAVLICLSTVAFAGDFHSGLGLVCSDCHVMHFSQQHDYTTTGSSNFTSLGTGPNAQLLRSPGNDLCLSCHDGNATIADVLFTNTGPAVTRQAGALNNGSFGLEPTGHTLGSSDDAPGSNPTWNNADGLSCTDCHNAHGYNPNGNAYRNLDANPGNYSADEAFVSYASGAANLTVDVQVTAPLAYDVSNVDFNNPVPAASAYAAFCKGCHTDFHGAKAGAELGGTGGTDWIRHPTNDAVIGAVGGGHSNYAAFAALTNQVKVMSASGTWPAADNSPSCMSCHKAHGNQNAFGLIYMSGTGTVDEEGDSGTGSRDLCKQCHIQG
jgi:hypothetical protein